MKLIEIKNTYSWGWHLRVMGIGLPYPRIPTSVSRLWKKRFDGLSKHDLMALINAQCVACTGKEINWETPETFVDKLNWLKVNYHAPLMTICADKVKAREFFTAKIPGGERFLVRQLGVYDCFSEIDVDVFPESFVLKSNWGSGSQMIVKNKKNFNKEKARSLVSRWTDPHNNHYFNFFEWGYKDIVPKIVAEEFLSFNYKLEFFCFNGQPKFFWIVMDDKTKDTKANFYTLDWDRIPVANHYPNFTREFEKPRKYGEMLDVARVLCADFPFVRCDFYVTEDGYRFSEMTFYHWAGYCEFAPEKYNLEWGKMLKLPSLRECQCLV